MAPSETLLYDLAAGALAIIEAAYAEREVAVPARRYVGDGLPAWDCEQLVVWVEQVPVGRADQPELSVDDCLHLRAALLNIDTVRCAPPMSAKGDAPTVAAIDASAQRVLADPMVQFNALLSAYRAETWSAPKALAFDSWLSLGPDGGFVGGRLTVRALVL